MRNSTYVLVWPKENTLAQNVLLLEFNCVGRELSLASWNDSTFFQPPLL